MGSQKNPIFRGRGSRKTSIRVRQLTYVRRRRMYIRLRLWRTHDFGQAYVETYAHFFPVTFSSFQKFFGFCNFILFKHLLLHIWPLVFCLTLEKTDSLLYTFVLKKPYFSIFGTNYLINFDNFITKL